jgi:hypothetical protein
MVTSYLGGLRDPLENIPPNIRWIGPGIQSSSVKPSQAGRTVKLDERSHCVRGTNGQAGRTVLGEFGVIVVCSGRSGEVTLIVPVRSLEKHQDLRQLETVRRFMIGANATAHGLMRLRGKEAQRMHCCKRVGWCS